MSNLKPLANIVALHTKISIHKGHLAYRPIYRLSINPLAAGPDYIIFFISTLSTQF